MVNHSWTGKVGSYNACRNYCILDAASCGTITMSGKGTSYPTIIYAAHLKCNTVEHIYSSPAPSGTNIQINTLDYTPSSPSNRYIVLSMSVTSNNNGINKLSRNVSVESCIGGFCQQSARGGAYCFEYINATYIGGEASYTNYGLTQQAILAIS